MNYEFGLKFETLIIKLKTKKYLFVDSQLESNIKKIIKNIFLNLNNLDSEYLFLLVKNIIDEIAIRNGFINEEKYYHQFNQNNFLDIKAILNLTLPYMDDKNNYKKHNNLKNLNDLLQPKETFDSKKIKEMTNNDFKYCNIAYDLLTNKNNSWIPYENIYSLLVNNYYALLHTIEVTSGKLYINWMNIRPLTINTYKKSSIYRNTLNKFKYWENQVIQIEDLESYYGIYIGDIYNTFVQDFYFKIKNSKWLIYVTNYKGKLITNINIINEIIPLKNILRYINWSELDNDYKIYLTDRWNKLKISIRNNDSFEKIDKEIIKPIFKYLVVFFRTKYSKKKLLTKIYEKFGAIKEIKDDDDDQNEKDLKIINQMNELELLDLIEDIEFEYLYDFLFETIRNIEDTFYGRKLILYDQNNEPYISSNSIVINDGLEYPVIMKNLYNYGKSLYHNNYNGKSHDWDTKYEFYQSMNKENKIYFLNKILGKIPINSWFSLKNNYKYVYPDENKYSMYINQISSQISANIIDIVFENLIYKGVLSEFIPQKELTDDNILPSTYIEQNKHISKNMEKLIFNREGKENYQNAYYFITKKKYKEINNLKIYKKGKYLDADYFKYLTNEQPFWFRFYAMDWICQIQFFHHYIHNRVLLVTGSTGQGKSTQAPKLLMYSLIMIDYKLNGKVVCTQPRVPPTTGNAYSISSQMGIPIKKYSDVYKDSLKTDNFWIQFKHMMGSHINNRFNSTFLRLVTDGTLLEEMVSNPPLKEQFFSNKKNDYIYGDQNKYDIVIVDEAHEHNVNMDFILTIARNSLYLNNSLKLVIISATIDEDEPIYRRYFREINDNIMYPLNLGSDYSNNIMQNQVVERKFIDRRYHISPPGKTTQYIIKDIYLNNVVFTNDDQKNSEIAQELSIKRAIEITRNDPLGEVLLFSTGMGEIKQIVQELNKVMPPGNIALPYYGNMNMKYKDIIQNIDKEIKFIRNKRINITNEWGPKYIVDENVSEGIYKRAIIVATNVAEASVTIPRLKYVIDNGYAKIAKYNIDSKTSSLVVEKISESSRIQRRGRVGRIADGLVYYMYKKGAREAILPKYNITNQDISLNLYKLLQDNFCYTTDGDYDKNKKEVLLLDPYFDPNIYENFNLNYNILFTKQNNTEIVNATRQSKRLNRNEMYIFTSEYSNILIKQFTLNQETLSWTYSKSYFFESYNMDGNRKSFLNNYPSGYNIDILIDSEGEFYIIHPNEGFFKRNILNGIILNKSELVKKYLNEISLIRKFFYLLTTKLLIVNVSNKIEFDLTTKGFINSDKIYKKTILGQKILDLTNALKMEKDYSFSIAIAIQYNCLQELIVIISMLEASTYTLKNWIRSTEKNKKFLEFDSFLNIHGDINSDFITLLNIYNNFRNSFGSLYLFNLHKKSKSFLLDPIKEKFEKVRKKYYDYSNRPDFNITEPPNSKIPLETYQNLVDLSVKGELFNDQAFQKMFYSDSELGDKVIQQISKKQKSIQNWCYRNYVKYETLMNFINIYYNNIKNIITIDRDNQIYDEGKIKWFEQNLKIFQIHKNINLNDNIVKSFIFSDPFSIVIKNKSIEASRNDFKPILTIDNNNNRYIINTRFRGSDDLDSSVKFPSDLVYYLSKINYPGSNIENLGIISNLNILWLVESFPHMFNPLELHNFKTYNADYKVIRGYPEYVKKINAKMINNFKLSMLDNFSNSSTPIINEYYKTIKNKIRKI
jgi:HrpA-like RNA helicase